MRRKGWPRGPENEIGALFEGARSKPRVTCRRRASHDDANVGLHARVELDGLRTGVDESLREAGATLARSSIVDRDARRAEHDVARGWNHRAFDDLKRPFHPRSTSSPSASQWRKPPARKPTWTPSLCSFSLHPLASSLRP